MVYELLPLAIGQELTLPSGYIARPFRTTHTIASQGYLVGMRGSRHPAELWGGRLNSNCGTRAGGGPYSPF